VGDVYAAQGDRVLSPGALSDLLDPAPRLPRVRRERLADVADVVSDAVSAKAGLGLLEGFVTALGGSLAARARAEFKGSRGMRFRLEDATRAYVSPSLVGTAIRDCRMRSGHALSGRDYRHS